MNSMKVLSFLLVVGLSQSAPQNSQQGVVGQVIGQLQPAIQRLVASALGAGRQTGGFGSGTVGTTGFSQGSGFGQATTGFSQGSSLNQGSSASSGLSATQLTSSVVTSLQPAIASAVAQALRNTQSRPSTSALSPEEEERINAQQSANAQYNYEYKVGDDDKQTYISHKEARNGENVEGTYNYIDATGALVTVDYQAGPMGYTENREVQEGAVQIDQRNIPQPWTGPLAGVSSSSPSASGSSSSSSSSLSQSDLIAQILRAIQPQISSAVQSAVGSRNIASTTSGRGSSGLSFANTQTAPRRGFNSEANLISSVIGALQPQISGAVQSAISRSRPAQVRRPVAPRPAPSSGVNDVFGGSGVRIQTPEFNIQY